MSMFKTVAVMAALVTASAPALAARQSGGGGRSPGAHSSQRSAPHAASRSGRQAVPTRQTSQRPQMPKHTSQRPHTQKHTQHHQKPHHNPHHQKPHHNPQHKSHYPTHHTSSSYWHTAKYWPSTYYRPYRDTYGRYYDSSSRCWSDGYKRYCGTLPFRYVGGAWYYGTHKWYRTSYGWKCDAPETPVCDTCQAAAAPAPAPTPVCTTCAPPAPAPVCETCAPPAPPAPAPVCETCAPPAPPPACETCSEGDET
jgi:hypothetical protein